MIPLVYTDNELLARLIARLNDAISAYPFVGLRSPVTVQQKQQPTQQGVPLGPTVFIERLFDHRHGSSVVLYDPAIVGQTLTESEVQVYETTFQLSALAIQDPRNLAAPTAADLCNVAAFIVQSRSFLRQFAVDNVGVLRVSEVRNLYFTDDRGRQESHPSFDLVLTYGRATVSTVPLLQSVELGLYPI